MNQKISLAEYIKVEATKMGFDLVRIMDARALEKEQNFYKEWLEKGYGADMEWLKKEPEKRGNPEKIFPGTKSVICLGMNYFPADEEQNPIEKPSFGVARYARTRDYHKVIGKKLKKLCQIIDEKSSENADQKVSRSYIDTGPVFDRSFSEKSGLGFIGKNSCLITRELGSYIFLAEIFVTVHLKPDEPSKWKGACGSCKRCIDICPTNAILPDRTIDARRCISYLTIENRGEIPQEFREKVGTWLFGCDLCQEICPHNVRSKPTKVDDFQNIRIGTQVYDLQKILEIKTDEEFLKAFAGTPLMRAKRRGLIRNACIVAGNLHEKSLIPALKKIAKGKDKMLAEHATWAIKKITAP
ncbi:MAG: tRNA epoxyqueuosine(34) reductase QueG [Patescibacteria group bacterium]